MSNDKRPSDRPLVRNPLEWFEETVQQSLSDGGQSHRVEGRIREELRDSRATTIEGGEKP
jgi:hypothetical protein